MSRPRKLGLFGGVAFVGGLVALVTVAASRAGHVAPPTRAPLRPEVGAVATTSFVAAETGRHEVRVVVPRSLKAADLAAAVGPRDAAAPPSAPPPFGADAKVTRDGTPVATGRLDDDRAPVWDADAVSILAAAFDATPGATYAVEVRVSRAPSLAVASRRHCRPCSCACRRSRSARVTRGAFFGATLLLAAGTIALVAAGRRAR
jgi:hypothetical protein